MSYYQVCEKCGFNMLIVDSFCRSCGKVNSSKLSPYGIWEITPHGRSGHPSDVHKGHILTCINKYQGGLYIKRAKIQSGSITWPELASLQSTTVYVDFAFLPSEASANDIHVWLAHELRHFHATVKENEVNPYLSEVQFAVP